MRLQLNLANQRTRWICIFQEPNNKGDSDLCQSNGMMSSRHEIYQQFIEFVWLKVIYSLTVATPQKVIKTTYCMMYTAFVKREQTCLTFKQAKNHCRNTSVKTRVKPHELRNAKSLVRNSINVKTSKYGDHSFKSYNEHLGHLLNNYISFHIFFQ